MPIIINSQNVRFRFTVVLKTKVSKEQIDATIESITFGTKQVILYEIRKYNIQTSSQRLASRLITADTLGNNTIKQIKIKRKKKGRIFVQGTNIIKTGLVPFLIR